MTVIPVCLSDSPSPICLPACVCAAFFTPAGWALACLGAYQQSYPVTCLFGVFHGIGAALTYISVTSTLQRWYSEFKGLGACLRAVRLPMLFAYIAVREGGSDAVISMIKLSSCSSPPLVAATGIAVMGFGLGSLIITTAGKALLDPKGDYKWPVYKVQGVFAATFLCAFVLVLPFLREPPPGFIPPTQKYKDEDSWRGFLVSGNREPLGKKARHYICASCPRFALHA